MPMPILFSSGSKFSSFFYTLKAKWIRVLIFPLLTPWPMKYYDLRWMSSFFAQDGGSFEINESSDIFDFGVAGWLLSDFR